MTTDGRGHRVLNGQKLRIAVMTASAVFAVLLTTDVRAQSSKQVLESKGPSIVVTGTEWMSATADQRRAFLVGIGNLIVAEGAYAKRHNTEMPFVSDQILKGIAHLNLAAIESIITRWYEANPGRLSMPVMGIIWQDIAGHGDQGGKKP